MIRGLLLLSASCACLATSVANAQVSPSAFTTYTRYDVMGRVVATIGVDPDAAGPLRPLVARTSYDLQGRVASVETGYLTSWQSDAVEPANWGAAFVIGSRKDFFYDADGNKVREAVSGGGQLTITDFSYDGIDRVRCVTQRMNSSLPLTTLIDACTLGPEGSQGADRITRTSYNGLDKPTLIEKAVGTAIQQNYATYTYDSSGRTLSVTDANSARAEYQYDSFGRLRRWVFPSKTTANLANQSDFEEYGYDANGNRTSLRKRDGVTITYQYDALNRQTVKTVPRSAGQLAADPTGGSTGYSVFYGYDLRGLQLYARFGSTSGAGITNGYDNAGRLTSSSTNMDGINRTVSWIFDANGNRSRVQHPDGAYFEIAYDNADRVKDAKWTGANNSNILFFVAFYDQFGRQDGRSIANSLTTINYDGIGRRTNAALSFMNGSNNLTTALSYNPASQIIAEARNNSNYVWTPIQDTARTYAANGLNQYVSAGPATFTYDDNGNLTSDGTTSYVYDAENRLVSSSASGGTMLAYDPLGRLWQTSSANTGITGFVYEGDHVAVEYDGAGAMLRRFFWGAGADEPILQDEGGALNCGGTRFLHANHQGSIIAASNCDGNHTNINRYDEYGIPQPSNWGRFQYTGQAWLPELGMYYYKARIYSPTLGRFLQTDPIGYDDQVNLYAYVGNDPLNFTDPTGRYQCSKSDCKVIAGYMSKLTYFAEKFKPKNATEKASLANVKSFLAMAGTENDNTNITIKNADLSGDGTNDRELMGKAVGNELTLDFAAISKTGGGDFTGAQVTAHEGVHLLDIRRGGDFGNNLSRVGESERRAYSTEFDVGQFYASHPLGTKRDNFVFGGAIQSCTHYLFLYAGRMVNAKFIGHCRP